MVMLSMPPFTGLNVLSVRPGVEEAGQAGEARRDGVPLVETEAAAQRIGTGHTWRALLRGHLQKLASRTREGCRKTEVTLTRKHTTTYTHCGRTHSSRCLWLEGEGLSRSLEREGWRPSIATLCCHTLCTGSSSLTVRQTHKDRRDDR